MLQNFRERITPFSNRPPIFGYLGVAIGTLGLGTELGSVIVGTYGSWAELLLSLLLAAFLIFSGVVEFYVHNLHKRFRYDCTSVIRVMYHVWSSISMLFLTFMLWGYGLMEAAQHLPTNYAIGVGVVLTVLAGLFVTYVLNDYNFNKLTPVTNLVNYLVLRDVLGHRWLVAARYGVLVMDSNYESKLTSVAFGTYIVTPEGTEVESNEDTAPYEEARQYPAVHAMLLAIANHSIEVGPSTVMAYPWSLEINSILRDAQTFGYMDEDGKITEKGWKAVGVMKEFINSNATDLVSMMHNVNQAIRIAHEDYQHNATYLPYFMEKQNDRS